MQAYFNNKRFSDCDIIHDKKTFHCHKIILTKSSFFESMFNFENEDEKNIIKLNDKFEYFEEILKFMYDVELKDEDLVKIAKEADFFGLKTLKNINLGRFVTKFRDTPIMNILSDEFFDEIVFQNMNVVECTRKLVDDERLMRFMNTRRPPSNFYRKIETFNDMNVSKTLKFEFFYWINHYINIDWRSPIKNTIGGDLMEVLHNFKSGQYSTFADCLDGSNFLTRYGKIILKHKNILVLQDCHNIELSGKNPCFEKNGSVLQFDLSKIQNQLSKFIKDSQM